MSKTLFWHIFKELMKIFLLSLGVVTGILVFGGLLKPIMEYGLSGTQVLNMLAYFTPAAQTYAIPVAALYATTVVYGRLSADNELTACRACGISYLSLMAPAFLVGAVLAGLTLFSVCYIVPTATLKVEKVIYSSLSDIVVKSIEREHRIKLPSFVIYASKATKVPGNVDSPDDETVVLENPMFSFDQTQEIVDDVSGKIVKIKAPMEFYSARRATVLIHRGDTGIEFSAKLEGGSMVPRNPAGAEVGAIEVADIGPFPLESPIREKTQFMTIEQLREFYNNPLKHRDIRRAFQQTTEDEQSLVYLDKLQNNFRDFRELVFDSGNGEIWEIQFDKGVKRLPVNNDRLMFLSSGTNREIHFIRRVGGAVSGKDEARNLTIKVSADSKNRLLRLYFTLDDALLGTDEQRPHRPSFMRTFSIPMTPELSEIAKRDPKYYKNKDHPGHAAGSANGIARLRSKLPTIHATINAEFHSRASFSISCFILVLIGSAMGMMFKTGNFLSAFALSVIPAFLCIVLMVTGQHIAEGNANNLRLGQAVIWSGNAVVGAMVMGLIIHLRRQ